MCFGAFFWTLRRRHLLRKDIETRPWKKHLFRDQTRDPKSIQNDAWDISFLYVWALPKKCFSEFLSVWAKKCLFSIRKQIDFERFVELAKPPQGCSKPSLGLPRGSRFVHARGHKNEGSSTQTTIFSKKIDFENKYGKTVKKHRTLEN